MILSAIAAAGRGPASGDVRWFDIGMVPLSRALVTVGLQGGVSVAGTDPILAQRRLRAPIRGRMTVEQALARLLAGTGLVAVRTASEVYRIERAPHVVDPAPPPPRHHRGCATDLATTCRRWGKCWAFASTRSLRVCAPSGMPARGKPSARLAHETSTPLARTCRWGRCRSAAPRCPPPSPNLAG